MYMREQKFCRCFACDGILYQVRRGDTLFSVCRRFQVALEDVMDANPFINVYRLEPGMQICVPVRETEEENMGDQEGMQRTWKDDGGDFCPYGLCRDPMRFDGTDW